MDDLFKLINESKNGNEQCVMEVIARFEPLIKKYSRKLKHDDLNAELRLCLLESILYIPIGKSLNLNENQYIISYLNKCIKHKYIYLSKKIGRILDFETEFNADILFRTYEEYLDDAICIKNIMEKISKLQQKVIKEVYFNDISEEQLANELNISRQAVNRTKNRALKKLRELYCYE